MSSQNVSRLLKKREFIDVATCDFKGRPNVAPKFLLKTEGDYIYLVDYIFGHTWENLKINPRVSLSFIDSNTLIGYQLNGAVEIIDSGQTYEQILDELAAREITLSAERIIEGVNQGRRHSGFEVGFSQKVVIFKVKIEEIVEIAPQGTLKRQAL